jgi:hypothetical protein
MRRRTAALSAGLAVIAATASGCASHPAAEAPAQAEASSILSVITSPTPDFDPVSTPAELAQVSEFVIEGRIAGFSEGRDVVVTGTDDHLSGTTILTIDDVTVVKGDPAVAESALVSVELLPMGWKPVDELATLIPAGTPVLVYLVTAWDGSDPIDEALADPSAGRPSGEPLFAFSTPQSLVLQAGDLLVWPMLGATKEGVLADARPDGTIIAR